MRFFIRLDSGLVIITESSTKTNIPILYSTGVVSTCIGHPMDTIMVIQQVINTSAMDATKQIYKKDKVCGNQTFFNQVLVNNDSLSIVKFKIK